MHPNGINPTFLAQSESWQLSIFFESRLKDQHPLENLPRPKKEHKLPTVLNRPEVLRLLDAVENLKHRAIILLTYSGGLRLGEVVRLKVEDIDLDRKLVHVRQGKHRKDRYTMLTTVARKAVQDYRRQYPPETWLFPGARPGRHLTERSVQKAFDRACKKANINKQNRYTRYGIPLRHTCLNAGRTCDISRCCSGT